MAWEFFSSLVKPVAGLISEAIEDKDLSKQVELELKRADNDALKIQQRVRELELEVDKVRLERDKMIVELNKADATQGNFLQRSWRPILALVAVACLAFNLIGLPWLVWAGDADAEKLAWLERYVSDNLPLVLSLISALLGVQVVARQIDKAQGRKR